MRGLEVSCPNYDLAMSSAKPYIGCKIGLISKAQNRYEGILYTIDKVNSTVVLAKGECCRPVQKHRMTDQIVEPQFYFGWKLLTSQMFWNGGATHRQTDAAQR